MSISSIGETLRQERLRRGLSLEQISDQTKISVHHLEAIEANDLEALPGVFFTRSFVRQYARTLDLDERDFEPELEKIAEPVEIPVTAALAARKQADFEFGLGGGTGGRFRDRRPLGSVIGFVLVVLACSGLYTVWQRARLAPPHAKEPAPVAEAATPAPKAAEPAPQIAEQRPEPPKPQAGTQPAAAPGAQNAVVSRPPAVPQEAVPADAPIRLDLGATEDTWIRVTSDSKVVFSGTLKPGQTKAFHGTSNVSVLTGNAGGLQVGWNGKPVGDIGPKGQIRVLEFTPEAHKIIERKPTRPAPPDIFD